MLSIPDEHECQRHGQWPPDQKLLGKGSFVHSQGRLHILNLTLIEWSRCDTRAYMSHAVQALHVTCNNVQNYRTWKNTDLLKCQSNCKHLLRPFGIEMYRFETAQTLLVHLSAPLSIRKYTEKWSSKYRRGFDSIAADSSLQAIDSSLLFCVLPSDGNGISNSIKISRHSNYEPSVAQHPVLSKWSFSSIYPTGNSDVDVYLAFPSPCSLLSTWPSPFSRI